jgi:hypothetical protein
MHRPWTQHQPALDVCTPSPSEWFVCPVHEVHLCTQALEDARKLNSNVPAAGDTQCNYSVTHTASMRCLNPGLLYRVQQACMPAHTATITGCALTQAMHTNKKAPALRMFLERCYRSTIATTTTTTNPPAPFKAPPSNRPPSPSPDLTLIPQ